MRLIRQTRTIVSGAGMLFVLLALAACISNKNVSQIVMEPARPANETNAKVDKALHDFFDDIDT